jgi:O-antigen/teichoic acid export membrane protein
MDDDELERPRRARVRSLRRDGSPRRDTSPQRGVGVRSRVGWTVADQAVSSLTNAALTIGLAGFLAPDQYGAFAVAFSVYMIATGVSQAVGTQVFSIRYAGEVDGPRRQALRAAAAAALLVGVLGGALVALIASFLGSPVRESLLALALFFPALLLQDTWRGLLIAVGSARGAFANDVLWTVLQALFIGLLLWQGQDSAAWFLCAWGLGAAAAATLGARQAGRPSSAGGAVRWLRGHRDISAPTLTDSLLTTGAAQVAFLLVGVVGTVGDVGTLRAAHSLLGPLNVPALALAMFALPELVRRRLAGRRLIRAAVGMSALLVVIDLTWGAVLLALPESVGTALLGETWPQARGALPGLILLMVWVHAIAGAMTVLRSLDRVSDVLRVALVQGPTMIVLGLVGAAVDGARGATVGFAAAGILLVPVGWTICARAVRRGHRLAPAGAAAAALDQPGRET